MSRQLDAMADLTDTKKYTDFMLIKELRRRGRLKVIDQKTNAVGDGLDVFLKYGTGWLVVDEIYTSGGGW